MLNYNSTVELSCKIVFVDLSLEMLFELLMFQFLLSMFINYITLTTLSLLQCLIIMINYNNINYFVEFFQMSIPWVVWEQDLIVQMSEYTEHS